MCSPSEQGEIPNQTNEEIYYCTFSYRHCKSPAENICTLVNAILVPTSPKIASHLRAGSDAINGKSEDRNVFPLIDDFLEEYNEMQNNDKPIHKQSSLIFVIMKDSIYHEVLHGSHRLYASYLANHSASDIDERIEISYLIDSKNGNIIRFRKFKAFKQMEDRENLHESELYGCLVVADDHTISNIRELSKVIGQIVIESSREELCLQKEQIENDIKSGASISENGNRLFRYRNASSERNLKQTESNMIVKKNHMDERSLDKSYDKKSNSSYPHQEAKSTSYEEKLRKGDSDYSRKSLERKSSANRQDKIMSTFESVKSAVSSKTTKRKLKDKHSHHETRSQSPNSSSVPVTSLSDISSQSSYSKYEKKEDKKENAREKKGRDKKFNTFTKQTLRNSKKHKNSQKETSEKEVKEAFLTKMRKIGDMGESKLMKFKRTFYLNRIKSNKNTEKLPGLSVDQKKINVPTEYSTLKQHVKSTRIIKNPISKRTEVNGRLISGDAETNIIEENKDTGNRLQKPTVVQQTRDNNRKNSIKQNPSQQRKNSSLSRLESLKSFESRPHNGVYNHNQCNEKYSTVGAGENVMHSNKGDCSYTPLNAMVSPSQKIHYNKKFKVAQNSVEKQSSCSSTADVETNKHFDDKEGRGRVKTISRSPGASRRSALRNKLEPSNEAESKQRNELYSKISLGSMQCNKVAYNDKLSRTITSPRALQDSRLSNISDKNKLKKSTSSKHKSIEKSSIMVPEAEKAFQYFYCTSCGFRNICSMFEKQEPPSGNTESPVPHCTSVSKKTSEEKPPKPLYGDTTMISQAFSDRAPSREKVVIGTPLLKRYNPPQTPTLVRRLDTSNSSINMIQQEKRVAISSRLPRYTVVKKSPQNIRCDSSVEIRATNRSRQSASTVSVKPLSSSRHRSEQFLSSSRRATSVGRMPSSGSGNWSNYNQEDQNLPKNNRYPFYTQT